MSKYQQSKEALDTSLLLWDVRPTQTSIQEAYDIIVYPSAVYDDTYGGPINFTIPPQSNGCLSTIEIVTEWQVLNGANNLAADAQVSVINNIANAMWSFVDVNVGDRVNIMQSMENAYAYHTFFNTALNNSSTRKDYLAISESFEMDTGTKKSDANCKVFFDADKTKILNKGSAKRAEKVKLSNVVKTRAKLHTSLLAHAKVLPTQMKINVTLVKNKDAFVIQAAEDGNKLKIKKVHLQCRFIRPRDSILNLQEEELMKRAARYDTEYPEITMRSIPQDVKNVSLHDLFPNKLPKVAFFVLQNTSDIAGDRGTSPFAVNRMNSFQLYVNNHEYFPTPISFVNLTGTWDDDFSEAYIQLYKALGLGMEGDCLINRDNFNINYIIGAVLTADKEHTTHHNLQTKADVRAEITLEDEAAGPFTLITYAVYDRLYEIDYNRKLTIIE